MVAAGDSDLVAVDDGNSTQLSALASNISDHKYLVSLSDIFKRVDEWSGTFPNSRLMAGQIVVLRP
jgi:hypothetical protein